MDKMTKAIREYALDTENAEKNYTLALLYEQLGQTAAAISYFLRTAERTHDKVLAYECLCKVGLCFERQGKRGNSVRGAYEHAVCLLPKRPEAYFLLARYYERIGDHVAGYRFAEQGLTFGEDTTKLRSFVEYPGKFGLLFQKAVSAWWWGKPDECRSLFLDLWNNHNLDSVHRAAVEKNLKQLNIPYSVKINTGLEPFMSASTDKMDIVLQGPYAYETKDIIDTYLLLPFVNNIIVSCWEDDKIPDGVMSNSRIRVVRNKKPEFAGTDNRNMQIVSSKNGLAKVTTKYSAKMRTDQHYDLVSMKNMYDFFMKGDKDGKLFVAGMYPSLLFHPRDHIFWGRTDKLNSLFECPLEYNGLGDRVRLRKDQLWRYTPYFTRAETYITAHYLAQFDERMNTLLIEPNLFLWDRAPKWNEAFIISKELMPKHFAVFPRKGINLKWKRKGWDSYPYEDQYASGERWAENFMPEELDLGDNDETFKQFVYNEIVVDRLYEKFHKVKDGDIVLDIGANAGIFGYSLRDRKPKHLYMVEPSLTMVKAIKNNCKLMPFPTTVFDYGISNSNGVKETTNQDWIYAKEKPSEINVRTFAGLIEDMGVDHIDFMKIDCEGGEYEIFTEEYHKFLTTKVGYIAGEWHLGGLDNGVGKFIRFRNLFLTGKNFRVFEPYVWKEVTHEVHSDEWVQNFYNYWNPRGEAAQLMVYLDNRL